VQVKIPWLENGFESKKNLKTSKVQNVGFLVFFIFWWNFIQIIFNFILIVIYDFCYHL